MAKRIAQVPNSRGYLANKKGDKKRGAPLGNTNTSRGPRVGRQDRPALASSRNPEADPNRAHRRRSKRDKSGGRDFPKGQNSHDGTVFRRGRDQLPRGNGTLMLRCVFHDIRDKIYRNLCKLGDTPRGALAFIQEYIDRTEGKPTKRVERTQRRTTRFILMTADGKEQTLQPRQAIGSGATPATASAKDQIIADADFAKV